MLDHTTSIATFGATTYPFLHPNRISNLPSLQKPVRNINVPAPNKLTQILPQAIQTTRRIESAIKMILQQKVHNANVRHLKAIDAVAEILFTKKFDEGFGREQTTEPIPFVVVADEETDVGVACLGGVSMQSVRKLGRGIPCLRIGPSPPTQEAHE